MCLIVNKTITKEFFKQHDDKDKEYEFVFLKSFVIDRKNKWLFTFIRNHFIRKPGIISVPRWRIKWFCIDGTLIRYGLHCYTSQDSIIHYVFDEVDIPVTVKKKHIIAFGRNKDVVVSQYKINNMTWDTLFRKGREQEVLNKIYQIKRRQIIK